MKTKATKGHNQRKNTGEAEKQRTLRKERNSARPKQRWVGGESVATGGHWVRP